MMARNYLAGHELKRRWPVRRVVAERREGGRVYQILACMHEAEEPRALSDYSPRTRRCGECYRGERR